MIVGVTAGHERGADAMFDITGREYKVLIDPVIFARGEPHDRVAEAFRAEHLAPLVREALGSETRLGRFDEAKSERRRVRYFDTPAGFLADNDYTLRERVDAARADDQGAKRKITLKLRTPDLIVAAGTSLGSKGESKFEEDIAPLEVAVAAGSPHVELANPPSFRSRFARSSTQTTTEAASVDRVGKVFDLFETLAGNLAAAGAEVPSDDTPLTAGPDIEEFVAKKASFALGDGTRAAFSLTLWSLDERAPRRAVAEISYAYDIAGPPSAVVARRALLLFVHLQLRLQTQGLIDLSATSKTALALGARRALHGTGMQHV